MMTNVKDQKLDDLTKLAGIGPKVQSRLRTSLKVQTYVDLAAMAPDIIESDLGKDKSIPAPLKTRKKIERWIADAQSLVEKSNMPQPASQEIWNPIDSFVLEFQSQETLSGKTKVRVVVQHVEHDANSKWDFQNEQEREELFNWMQREANLSQVLENAKLTDPQELQTFEKEVDEIKKETTLPKVEELKAIQISVIQGQEKTKAEINGKEKRPFLGHIHHEQPLDLEVTFVMPSMPLIANSTQPYSAQCQFHNLSLGSEPIFMEMGTEQLASDQQSILAKISDISLEPGIYDLGILIKGERPLGAKFYDFPKLNVL